jgi:hypothetical protein
MSQWAHHPWNMESHEAALACLVVMAAQPVERKNLEKGALVLCGRLLS